MAIAFDTASNSSNAPFTGTTLTWSHTCTGTNLVLVVAGVNESGIAVTGITYNGVAMTSITSNAANDSTYLYYLKAPATGAHSIVITCASSSRIIGTAISLTGVDQTTPLDVSNNGTGTSATPSLNFTTTVKGWRVDVITSIGSATNSAASGQTVRTIGSGNSDNTYMSTLPVAVPASSTVSWTSSSNTGYTVVGANFKDDGVITVNSNFLAFM